MAIDSLKPLELWVRRVFLQGLKAFGALRKKANVAADVAQFGRSPSILLLRQDRLGDVIMSTFILRALRKKYPDSRIGILLGKNNAGVEPLLPFGCEVFLYSKNLRSDWKTIGRLRRAAFDIAVDMTDKASVTSSMLIAAIGAKLNIGVEKENAVVYDITVPRFSQERVHITRRVAELLRPFGIDPETVDRSPILKIESRKVAGRIGFNVSSRSEDRSAPPAACAEIARGVLGQGFQEVVVFAAPNDRMRGETVVTMGNDSRIYLAEKTASFSEFAEQIASCEYLITVDTSVIQVAAAAKIPMLLLFKPMPGEHPWTPVGVSFEIYTQHPRLESLEPEPVLALFSKLVDRNSNVDEISDAVIELSRNVN
jgi:ADP-heptose:LPS heptosyltransferase